MAAAGSAVVGDAAGLVDPLSGEGIYAALASGTAIGPVIEDYLAGRVTSLAGYQAALEDGLLEEVATSTALMDIFHAYPAPFIWMMQHVGPFWRSSVDLIRGDPTYMSLTERLGPVGPPLLGPTAALGRTVTRLRRRRTARG